MYLHVCSAFRYWTSLLHDTNCDEIETLDNHTDWNYWNTCELTIQPKTARRTRHLEMKLEYT